MNPLINNSGMNPISMILQALKGELSPQKICQNILSQNPEAVQFVQQMQQACGTNDPREFVIQQCKEKGISEADVMLLAKSCGIK